MLKAEFLQLLTHKSFPEPVLVEQPANGQLDVHTHDFEVMALVTEGAITIKTDEAETLFQPGDMFHLQAMEPHSERYSEIGVKYLASRKFAVR